jgi:hypothetical protein
VAKLKDIQIGAADMLQYLSGYRLRRGPQDVRRDIQVPLAPSISRRLIPFAATVLRSLTLLRYRSRASSHNDLTPLTRLSRALRLRFAFPGSSSDFSFELQTLGLVRAHGLDCEHGGLYKDPITKKMRQFDIRAIAREGCYFVRLAIECKNIEENFPLLVSCVSRRDSESFHEVALVSDEHRGVRVPGLTPRAKVLGIYGKDSCYKPKCPGRKKLCADWTPNR